VLSRAWKWFTEKWPFYPLKHLLLDEEIAGGASFFYTLGTAILIILTLQIISGIIQLFYYVPTTDHAYNSVSYLRTRVPFGWLVHNMHYWGANAMVFLVALHMLRVYIWGAYKTQLTWLIGVALLLTTMALSFTGAPLIWDQRGFWAGEVGSSITGTVPVVGGLLKTILRGGETMGQLALSRFFALHIGIFIPALFFLIGIHIISFRTSGVVGPWHEEKRKHTGPFWPDQAFKDMVVGTIVFVTLIALCVFAPPPFTGAADPSNTTYVPKPEWNFLFLYQALKYFQGPLEPIGTAGVPTVLIALLVLLPFIDKSPERNPFSRPVAMACLVVYGGLIVVLTVTGYLSPGFAQIQAQHPSSKQTDHGTPEHQHSSRGKQDVVMSDGSVDTSEQHGTGSTTGIKKGKELFHSMGCISCHSIHGKGGSVGPALTHDLIEAKSRDWLEDQIRNPGSHFPNSVMPSFDILSDQQVDSLVDYLKSIGEASSDTKVSGKTVTDPEGGRNKEGAGTSTLSDMKAGSSAGSGEESTPSDKKLPGPAAYIIGDTENGVVLFKEQCMHCHGHEAMGNVPNPGSDDGTVPPLNPIDPEFSDKNPQLFAEKIDRMIQHGSVPEGPHPAMHMPAWGDTHALTQQEIANIEAYIMRLNGVDRAQLVDPGMQPRYFFIVTLIVFGIGILLLGGIWKRKFSRPQ
jgi:ubiquinol-cytochrome c reductase cytochrome b subunit